jgi:two-component system response regulator NreC
MSIRILLADDHKILREGLRALLEKESNIEVIGEAADGRETMRLVRGLSPDVVIMDITMPGLNGIVATRRIVGEVPGVKVIALSMHTDRRFVVGMLQAGAMGYVLKECAFGELARAVHTVAEGRIHLSSEALDTVVKDYLRRLPETDSSVYSLLTPRECEVFQLLAEGKNSRQIADLLSVTMKTVQSHRRHIMRKLNVDGVAGLTKYAINEGLIPQEL